MSTTNTTPHQLTDRQRRILEQRGGRNVIPKWSTTLTLPGRAAEAQARTEAKAEMAATAKQQDKSTKPKAGTTNTTKQVGTTTTQVCAEADKQKAPCILLAALQRDHPAAFGSPPVPLAKDIKDQIRDRYAARYSLKTTGRALAMWVGRDSYLEVSMQATHRINLDGSESAEMTEHERGFAAGRLRERTMARRYSRRCDVPVAIL